MFSYVEGGAGGESTHRANAAAFEATLDRDADRAVASLCAHYERTAEILRAALTA